jgi:hypothetical protein
MRSLTSALVYFVIHLLHGCATYNPSDYYDPNAKEKLGRVISKSLANYETRPAADNPIIAPIPGVPLGTTLVVQEAMSRNYQIPIYSYKIRTEDQVDIVVLSKFQSHNQGDCVKVFLSVRPDYPRMAPWEGCK